MSFFYLSAFVFGYIFIDNNDLLVGEIVSNSGTAYHTYNIFSIFPSAIKYLPMKSLFFQRRIETLPDFFVFFIATIENSRVFAYKLP